MGDKVKNDGRRQLPENHYTFAVIGGGIAGVSCIEQILEYDSEARILLISASSVVKEASQVTRLTKTLEDFVIVEKSLKSFKDVHQTVRVVHGEVAKLIPDKHLIVTASGEEFLYKKVCICTGSSPKVPFPEVDWDHILVIRDTESVQELARKVANAKKILVLGNGGIATEFVYEVNGVDITWAIKDKSISAHFVDPGAAEFFIQSKLCPSTETSTSSDSSVNTASGVTDLSSSLPRSPGIAERENSKEHATTAVPSKRRKYTLLSVAGESEIEKKQESSNFGSALGPDWHQGFDLKGQYLRKHVEILYETECNSIKKKEDTNSEDFPVFATFSNGNTIGYDLIVCAIGVLPNCALFKCCDQDGEKGIFINSEMKTSAQDVFAAGDVCYPQWPWSKHWFQMRLWTQARHMGLYAGKSMYLSAKNEDDPSESEDIDLDFWFENFSHVTRFFGFKVVLLGLYNGQGLDKCNQHLLIRCTKNLEYIKVVLENWRMQGAILIGETGLEETFENLILNQVDLSPYGEDLLNPDIDIEDYFD